MELKNKISEEFNKRFNKPGSVYASAGRINLIGEHTDYNGGFVFPGAIDKVIMAKIAPNDTDKVRVYSVDLDDYAEFGLNEADAPKASWARYIFGVCREVIKRGGIVKGFDTVFAGNVPLGAGLSSSAALESCFAFAINDIFNDNSIMDQFASIMGKADKLMRLDCRSMEFEYFPFAPEDYELILIDSRVKHELADSPYNKRRASCERVAKRLGLDTLRDATMPLLNSIRTDITAEDYFRAKFVIEEKERVLAVCDALNAGDYETVGRMMYETHRGLSDDYEVSCEELDFLNDIARECGVTGSRIMGGGFGGCTINLVKKGLRDKFIETAKTRFNEHYGHEPQVYPVVICDGAHIVE